jgi:hypothetical protein
VDAVPGDGLARHATGVTNGEGRWAPRGARRHGALGEARAAAPAQAVVENLAAAVLAKPQKGKALLDAVVEGILMEPSPDGYAVRVTLKKTNPAALGEDSGVGDSQSGCGGRI